MRVPWHSPVLARLPSLHLSPQWSTSRCGGASFRTGYLRLPSDQNRSASRGPKALRSVVHPLAKRADYQRCPSDSRRLPVRSSAAAGDRSPPPLRAHHAHRRAAVLRSLVHEAGVNLTEEWQDGILDLEHFSSSPETRGRACWNNTMASGAGQRWGPQPWGCFREHTRIPAAHGACHQHRSRGSSCPPSANGVGIWCGFQELHTACAAKSCHSDSLSAVPSCSLGHI